VDKDAGDQEGDVDANDQDNHSNKSDEENNGDDDDQDDELDQLQVQHCRGAHLASLFVKTFFQTLLREWFKMDKHRVDKFYTLIRLIVSQVYTYMAQRHWNVGIIRLFNDVLWEQVLSQTPNGVRFHLIDLTLEELAKVNSNEETTAIPLTEATFLDVMDPFIALTQNSDDRVVQARVVDKIWDKFLFHHSVASDTYESDLEDDKKQIMDQVQIKTVMEYIFQMASHETTQDQFRESIYDLYKTYVRKLKSAGRDVVLHQQNMLEDEEEYDVQEDTTKQTDDVEGGETQTEVEINPKDKVIEAKKTKKKKKKKKRPLSGPDEAANDTPTKKTKKAKRSSSEELEQPVKNSDSSEVKQSEEVHSKKEKKKKKKKNHHSDSADDEITISLAEQKKAQAGNVNKKDDKTPSKPRKEKKRTKTEDANDQSRRVSFGKVNRAKSHQASMKALKTCHPTIEPVTPEKGILRNKWVSPKSSGRKKPRRKAADYFWINGIQFSRLVIKIQQFCVFDYDRSQLNEW